MSHYEKRMIQYVGDFMETSILPELENGERTLILVTHDESCFDSNEGRSYCWLDENNRQIRPKGNGRSVMVSAFLCECHGLLKLDEQLQKNTLISHQIVRSSSSQAPIPKVIGKTLILSLRLDRRHFRFSEFCIRTVMGYSCSITAKITTPKRLML